MTPEEIIEMAKQAGMVQDGDVWFSANNYEQSDVHTAELEAFAKLVEELVAAKEREACAKLVEDSWMAFSRAPNNRLDITPFPELSYVAKVIRARGEH